MKQMTANADNCIILKDLTPHRQKKDKSYLCLCRLCGRKFIRSSRWLFYGHSDCGCAEGKNIKNVKLADYAIRSLDRDSKRRLRSKIAKMNNAKLLTVFDKVYIENKPVNEYTAVSNYMSLSSLYRMRMKIVRIFNASKAYIEKNESEDNKQCI